MIRVLNLSKSFNGQNVLDRISLEIGEGQIVAILGESGTGKTVLLKHLMGLMKPDEGRIEIDGVNITQLPEVGLLKIRKNIGYLFQEGALYDFMNVMENVAFPLREHTQLDDATITKKVRDILKIVDLEDVEDKYPSQLSGGMKKRVGLARAIILDSKILFCDEPTSGLDPIRSRDISNLIQSISRRLGCTTILTSHDIENSFRIADRIILMKDGHIAIDGKPDMIKASQNPFVREFVS